MTDESVLQHDLSELLLFLRLQAQRVYWDSNLTESESYEVKPDKGAVIRYDFSGDKLVRLCQLTAQAIAAMANHGWHPGPNAGTGDPRHEAYVETYQLHAAAEDRKRYLDPKAFPQQLQASRLASLRLPLEKAPDWYADLFKRALERQRELEKSLKPSCDTPNVPKQEVGNRAVAAGEEPLGVDEEPFLVVDSKNGAAYWGRTALAINANADLAVLSVLSSQKDRLVPYTDLLRAIKPNALSNEVKSLKEAPPEVKFAVAHIRKAFKDAGCPYKIRAIRNKGYRLLSFNE